MSTRNPTTSREDEPREDSKSPRLIADYTWGTLLKLPDPCILIEGFPFVGAQCNRAAKELLGVASAEAAVNMLRQKLPAQLLETVGLAASVTTGVMVEGVPAQLLLGGRPVPCQLTVMPLPVDGAVPRAVLHIRENVQARALPSSLQPSALSIPSKILSWIPIPYWVVRRNGEFLFQSPLCHTMAPEEMLVDFENPEDFKLVDFLKTSDPLAKMVSETTEAAWRTSSVITQTDNVRGEDWAISQSVMATGEGEQVVIGFAVREPGSRSKAENRNWGTMAQDMKLIVLARERERRVLAREIHDSLGQELTVLRLAVGRLQSSMGGLSALPAVVAEQFTAINDQVQAAVQAARRLSFELLSDLVAKEGLTASIDSLVARVRANLSIPGQLEVRTGWVEPSVELANNIFRCAQELLNNIAKHSGATRFIIRLGCFGEYYQLTAVDDGVGLSATVRAGSQGMSSLRERARVHRGKVISKTRPEVDGTSITITFYVDEGLLRKDEQGSMGKVRDSDVLRKV